ncbi:35872_t:CDS:1, partial [Racocetra persica]
SRHSPLQVIGSPYETPLLGNDWFEKTQARIHFDEQKLIIRYKGKLTEIPTSNTNTHKLF